MTAREYNPSARRWRGVALIGIPLALLIGIGIGASAAAPVEPVGRVTLVPASPRSPEPTLSPYSGTERLSGLGDDGSQAVREYYSHCQAARAAGVAPMFDDDAGYRSGLDLDNDGVACEMGDDK